MAVIDEVDQPGQLLIGSEVDVLAAMIDFYRATLLRKSQGLSAEQLTLASVPPSNLTLRGLLQHMTEVDRYWFEECIEGRDLPPIYSSESLPDGDFEALDTCPVAEVVTRFLAVCESSRRILSGHSLEEVVHSTAYGRPMSIRFVLVHLVDEYARHCGHADLIRQAIDGAVGY
ncbi:MAG: DinB family protein [Candidatus Dormiibacterota bacterium]